MKCKAYFIGAKPVSLGTGEFTTTVIPRLDRGIQEILGPTRFLAVRGMTKFKITSRFKKFLASEVL
jgi:hypothetical protein